MPRAFPSTSSTRSAASRSPRLGRLGEAGPHDEHVVAGRRELLPSRARQISRSWRLIRLRTTAVADGLRDREPEARPSSAVLAREPVEDEEARRDRAALPVDGVEVPRAREAVAALHASGTRSGREALAALRAAALEDRPAGAGGHAGAEAVLALPPAHVGLIGPFHRVEEVKKSRPDGGRRRASIDEACKRSVLHRETGTEATAERCPAQGLLGVCASPLRQARPHLWRVVWSVPFSLQIVALFAAEGPGAGAGKAVEREPSAAMLGRSRDPREGACRRRGAPNRADCGKPVGRGI